MIIRKIFKTGHSAAITLSTQLLEALHLKLGDEVKLELDESRGQVVVRPGHKASQLTLNLTSRPRLGQKR